MSSPAIAPAFWERTMPQRPKWVSPVVPWADCDRRRRDDLMITWSIGELGHLLTPSQLRTDAKMTAWSNSPKRQDVIYTLDSSRRWGKSNLLLKRALEFGATRKNWRMVYLGPEYKQLRKYVPTIMAMLTLDCPPGLLGPKQGPEWVAGEQAFYFRNTGSRLEILGLDVNPDGARGPAVDYAFGDELAFFANLEYVMQSVLMPQLLGRRHGRIECASTPPVSPSHYWTQHMVAEAQADGAHDSRTIEEADQYESDEIEIFIRKAGGRKSTICQREYFCQHITDETMAVIPEWREAAEHCVKAVDAPEWRDCYVSMDPGWKDHTAVLFGYWDFVEQRCVIEDEICAPRLNSEAIASEIKRKELDLWDKVPRYVPNAVNGHKKQPFCRVTDINLRLQQDLAMTHSLVFIPTQKDEVQQQVNAVRVAIGQHKIVVHPRCVKLTTHLKNAVWKNRDGLIFAREGGDMGHFDTIAALVYLWRIMQQHRHRNPFPREYRRYEADSHARKLGADVPAYASKWTYRGRQARLR